MENKEKYHLKTRSIIRDLFDKKLKSDEQLKLEQEYGDD